VCVFLGNTCQTVFVRRDVQKKIGFRASLNKICRINAHFESISINSEFYLVNILCQFSTSLREYRRSDWKKRPKERQRQPSRRVNLTRSTSLTWDWRGASLDSVIIGSISGLTLLLDNLQRSGQFPSEVGWTIVVIVSLLSFLVSLKSSRSS
jgi:hypothetical protein